MPRLRTDDPAELYRLAVEGSRPALARLLSLVERGGEPARTVSRLAFATSGSATTVGITGAPGAGKSTLTSALLTRFRAADTRVAVLAIDPSSPFTGGAILGDRVRMSEHALDDGVFIRSMATRGHLGGLALATPESARLLDAVGYPWVLIETVGVGQVEVEVAGATDTRLVVLNPGWGDAVQANKAGLLEIADVFVVNKADRAGTAETRRDLDQMLELSGAGHGEGEWRPPILETVASTGRGVEELLATIEGHGAWLRTSGELERRRAARLDDELQQVLVARVLERARALGHGDRYDDLRARVHAGDLDPWSAAEAILDPG